ncbi:MAG: HigB toxin protein [uncultured Sulfurovum sp.]|uniref:HigB toxin protein n=3 Tax=uncultured Sulfurovum sp. TaxID=269237 RepID=A0A6S6SR66_9BACT|nr:MAG: HigB toxin protein [uncultured Sulfurovum sp.]
MLYEIEYTDRYNKKLFKFLKKHTSIIERYKKTILLMEADPFHPSLRLHPLKGKLKELHSVSIDMQYRISIEFYIEDNKIIPVNIGTHDEVY